MPETIVAKTVTPIPDLTGTGKTSPPGQNLTASQTTAVEEVLAHFSKTNYRLPVKDDQDGTLKEEERFWLVR
jgi:hypothetical protein